MLFCDLILPCQGVFKFWVFHLPPIIIYCLGVWSGRQPRSLLSSIYNPEVRNCMHIGTLAFWETVRITTAEAHYISDTATTWVYSAWLNIFSSLQDSSLWETIEYWNHEPISLCLQLQVYIGFWFLFLPNFNGLLWI